MSVRGIRVRYFALAMAVIAIIAGVYLSFFQSRGFEKTTAVITAIEEQTKTFSNDDTKYDVTVEYSVKGETYTRALDYYSPSFKVGKSIEVRYDPNDPGIVHGGSGFGIYVLAAGIAILAITIFSIIKDRKTLKKLKETENIGRNAVYSPGVSGEERELYFLTDLGTAKSGHRIEDADRKILIEAKMTKYNLTAPYEFDFINHVSGITTKHLVGHEESTEWGMLLLDNNYTFKFDGEDIWKHLKQNGIRIDSRYGGGSGKLIGVNYVIYRDNTELARVESTSQFPHEDDAEEHSKLTALMPIQGFYRIWTREQNLDLLFLTLVAFARTQASDGDGGNYQTLFETIKTL